MTIELKNIKVNLKLSEETFNYSANLYWKGKKIGEVSNMGYGGEDHQTMSKNCHKEWVELTDYIDNLPKEVTNIKNSDGSFWEMTQNLETICHDLVSKHLDIRELNNKFKNRLVYTKTDGSVYETKIIKKETMAEFFADKSVYYRIKAKLGAVDFLNEMSQEKALETYRMA